MKNDNCVRNQIPTVQMSNVGGNITEFWLNISQSKEMIIFPFVSKHEQNFRAWGFQ